MSAQDDSQRLLQLILAQVLKKSELEPDFVFEEFPGVLLLSEMERGKESAEEVDLIMTLLFGGLLVQSHYSVPPKIRRAPRPAKESTPHPPLFLSCLAEFLLDLLPPRPGHGSETEDGAEIK